MKKFTALLLTVMMVFALAAGAAPTASAANPIHFKLSHPAAEGAHYDLMSKEFARLVEEKSGGKYIAIDDRAEAIRWCLDQAKPGDIYALLGKGHETYQEVKGVRTHFSEEEVVLEYFR